MKNFLDIFFVVCVASVVFGLLQGYLGKTVQRCVRIIFNPCNIEYLIILSIILGLLYFNLNEVQFCIDEDTDKKLLGVSGNNINIHNPNINITSSVSKALTNIGIGAAIGGGMSATANVIKGSALPPSVKFFATVAGGLAAGAIVTGTNAANTITQNSINSSSSSKNGGTGPYTANSPLEDIESNSATIETVMTFLYSNLALHIAILYLLFALGILYLIDKVVKNKINIIFIRNIFGERFYNLFIKGINFTSKSNQIWMLIIWIILVLSSIGGIYFAYFLLNNINIISEILQSK